MHDRYLLNKWGVFKSEILMSSGLQLLLPVSGSWNQIGSMDVFCPLLGSLLVFCSCLVEVRIMGKGVNWTTGLDLSTK